MARLDTLELEIVQKSKNVSTNSIDRLTASLKNLAQATWQAESINAISRALSNLVTASHGASKVPGTIKRIGDALQTLLVGVRGADSAVETLNRVADAISRISEAGQNLSGVSAEIRAVTRAVNSKSAVSAANPQANIIPTNAPATETGVEEIAIQASNASAKLGIASRVVQDFGNVVQGVCTTGVTAAKGLAKGLKSVYSAAWSVAKLPLAKVGDTLGNIGKKVKNLVSSFGRIAMYRALRTAIKAITQGFSEGIKHLYQWSELTGNNFKNSMDSLATSAHYLRDSLGAMASPLIDALAPAIDALVEKFVSLLNVINQFAAALTGKDTWRKAIKTPTTYSGAMKDAADSTKKATKAQKELNKALQGFDELNLITTSEIKARKPTSSGSADTGVSEKEFEVVEVADWIKDIKNKINEGDWAGAGTLLAEKLNGMVSEWKAQEFGNKIGEKFQKGLDFYLAFMKKFKWEDLGTKIGAMFNGIFETMSAEDLGHALVEHIKAAVKLAKGFLKEANSTFQELGVAVSTAINDLFDPDFATELGDTIGTGIQDAITFLKTLIVGSEKVIQNYDTGETFTVKVGGIDFSQAGESLMTAIFTAIKTINWSDLGETMAGLFTGILDAIGAGIKYAATHIDEIASALKDFAIAFFKRIWEWFWPAFREYLFSGEYTAGANDRKDGPVVSNPNMTREEKEVQFDTELDSAVAGFKGSLEWIEEHNPFNVEVTDNGNTIGTQDEKVSGLNKELDYTDGTFTSTFGTKNLKDTEKKVNPFKETLDKTKGKFDALFGTKDLDKTKKRVNPYYTTLRGVGKTYTTTFKTENLDATKKKVEELNKQLADTGKNWKLTITADLRLKPTKGSYYTVEPMATGGFPTQGSLFVAGEVPGQTEMVGDINGKTGVASGKEITGIADAVYNTGDAEAQLLREQNSLLRQILAKKTDINLAPNVAAGRWVAQSQAAYARATGG